MTVRVTQPSVPRPVFDPMGTVIKMAEASDLAARMRRGDGAALTEAYGTYRAPLVRYAHLITGDVAAAHDVVQDVFVRLWESRDSLIVRTSFRALAYTMTRNRALNERRNQARVAPNVDVEDAADARSAVGVEGPAHDWLQTEELGRHLARWIEALPPRRAEAFVLSRYHDLSHSDIAALMGLSVRTVDTHIVHALRDLRARLDALYGPDAPVSP